MLCHDAHSFNMKNCILYISLILFACQPDERLTDIEVGELTPDSIYRVNTFGMFKESYWEGYAQTTFDGEKYLIGLDWMKNRIDVINLTESNQSYPLKISSDGPNGIPDVKLSVVAKADTLFVLSRFYFYICKISPEDHELKVIKSLPLADTGTSFNQSTVGIFYPNLPTFSLHKEYAVLPYYPRLSVRDTSFFSQNNLLVVDLENLSTISHFVEWPLALLYADETLFHPINQKLFTLVVEDHVYISHPFTSLIRKIPIQEKELGEVSNWAEPLPEMDQLVRKENQSINEGLSPYAMANDAKNAHFWPLQYNAIKDRFFRVFLFPFGEDDNSKRIREREKWLLEYDKGGRLVTKTLIPRELDMQPILLPDGAYGFPKSPGQEDFMEFAVYR